jgi:hypothetical protein
LLRCDIPLKFLVDLTLLFTCSERCYRQGFEVSATQRFFFIFFEISSHFVAGSV